MSDEQLISIEENGDYWLSKSNTAYHIINPKASDLIYIDEIGNFSLGKSGDQHYILDANGNSIRFDGPTYAPGYSFTDTPLHVEESFTNEGFQNDYPDGNFWVLFQREEWANKGGVSNYGYMARKYDASGVSKGTDFVKTGNHVELRPYMEYEAMFGVDLNNDKIIPTGINPNNLMDISGNQHHIDDGHVSDGIILKIDNTTIDPNSNGGLNATQVQKNGDYYEVLLEHENVKYDVWKVNSEGNFVSSIKAKLWQDEKKFGVDINLDGDTGLQPVEEIGSVHLKLGDNTYNGAPQYYIVDGIKDPIGLTHGGAATRSTSYAGWSATQVIASGDGGYEVLWSHTGGKYEVWKVSSEGNFLSSIKAKLWQDEKKFGVDINLDGDTGLQPVEEIGSVHLKLGDNTYNGAPQYYIVDGIKDPIGLTHGGAATRSTSYAGWSATQVIASGDGGYEVLWSHTGGKYEVWKVSSEGNFLSYNKAKLWQDELKFGVDLNGDSDTGLVTVEEIGSVHLKLGDNTYNGAPQYYIVDGIKDPIGLTHGAATKGSTSYAGWSATHVIASGDGGYEVLWSHTGGKYEVWKVNSEGNFLSYNKAKLWQDEKKFGVDINLDGDTGLQPVEEIGSVHLKLGDNTYNGAPQYYIVDGIKDPIGLTHGGAATRSTSYAGWSATQVIASGDGGYEVLWSHTGGKYEVWKVSSEGNFLSYNKAKLWQDELKFGVDLNGDSDTGLVTVEEIGSVHLKLGDNTYNGAPQYYIVDGIKDPIGLTHGGAATRSTSYAGWSATQVIASGDGGYEVLWSHTGGKYEVWKVNSEGNFLSYNKAKLWQDELKFGVDLNGDSDTGLVTVEDNGGVLLKHDDNSYFIVKGSNDPVGLTSGGASKGPTSFPGWSATQVEASASGGYEVFWSHSSGKTTAWKVDALGSYQSHISVTKSVTESGITIIKYDDHSWKFGGNGNDSLSGSIGNDTIDGGDGNDHINGYSGHDTLMGGDGNDGLRGSHGNDQIDGGTGSDTITTGSGLDKIILRIGDGGNTLSNADIITDFTDGSDNFGLDGGLLFSQLVIAQGSDAYASDTIISAGSEYLAILQGIDASLLSDADFETVDIA